jgi:hypothetical protein
MAAKFRWPGKERLRKNWRRFAMLPPGLKRVTGKRLLEIGERAAV